MAQVSYVYSLPYTAKVQPHGIRYPVTFWRDHQHGRFRMDTFNGTNSIIEKEGYEYEVSPRLDKQRCFVYTISPDDEPKAGRNGADDLPRALPDLRGWAFVGEEDLNGQEARLWLFEKRHEGKVVQYKFYTSAEGLPLRLHMRGTELFDGAHFDEWVADYYDYEPGRPGKGTFKPPKLCKGVKPEEPPSLLKRSTRGLRMRSLVPTVTYGGDQEYDSFLSAHGKGRALRSLTEYRMRAEVYRSNAALIAAHNAAPNQTYSMAMNRFGDWTREEVLALMLPNHGRPSQPSSNLAASKYEIPYKPLVDPSRIPRAVSWEGVVSPVVKDQANCGSCWAFGAAGAMEGAWFMATGQRASFAEQQMVDCSWDHGRNFACDGGDPEAAIEYVAASGGIALTADYEYLGQDGYCKENSTKRVGKFKGYSRVPRNDAAVMEAVYSRGPLAVSIDAAQPSLTFYSGGVYFDPKCQWKADELDHSVVLVGYGTNEKEGDYWLIRNSW
ncbi:hypothetical protein N2152v2_001935 [Parachlorella kessleri]